jgi:short-subunit dehydrogenase
MRELVVVSGGSKGIGRALVEKFAAQGYDIAVCSRSAADLEVLKTEIESKYKVSCFTKTADVSRKEEVLAFGSFVRKIQSPVAALVNNAGVFLQGRIISEEDGVLESQINTNLYSAYHLTRSLIDKFLERRKGYIFNICSIASIMAYPEGGSYSISKFALLGFSKSLREELKTSGVKVSSVIPGATLTDSWAGVDLPAERFIKAEDVADAIWSAFSLSDHVVVEEIVLRPQLGDI